MWGMAGALDWESGAPRSGPSSVASQTRGPPGALGGHGALRQGGPREGLTGAFCWQSRDWGGGLKPRKGLLRESPLCPASAF